MLPIRIQVNGEWKEAWVAPQTTLLELLRETWGLTGTKRGCDEGDCGACTVLMNGKPVNACLVLAVRIDGSRVTTIEGLGKPERPHALQQAFVDLAAVQCGFCAPGMILSAKALLDDNPDPSEPEIRQALSGNICRCTGYSKIVEAVKNAAHNLRQKNATVEK